MDAYLQNKTRVTVGFEPWSFDYQKDCHTHCYTRWAVDTKAKPSGSNLMPVCIVNIFSIAVYTGQRHSHDKWLYFTIVS